MSMTCRRVRTDVQHADGTLGSATALMYNQDFDQRGQDVDGLDMFVGSGIDFLSEVTINDMDRELFNSNVTGPHLFSPENFTNFAPLAASLGPPGTTLGFDHRSGSFGSNPSLQMPCAEDHAGAAPLCSCMKQHPLKHLRVATSQT